MAADGDDMEVGSGTDASRKAAGKTRLMTLEDLDGRTRAAQHVKETQTAIFRDLGGEDALSTLERAAAKNAALTVAMIHDTGARWLIGEPVDPTAVSTLLNAFNRTAAILGWQRRAKDVTPNLSDYVAQGGRKQAQEAA